MTEHNDGSNRQTKNSWKYLSFVLMGILAVGVTVTTLPQAMAKPPEGSPGEDMMMLLQQIRDTLLGIDEKTGFKAVEFDVVANPPNDSGESFELLPFVEGHAYTGHMEGVFTPNTGNRITLVCGASDADNIGIFVINQEDDQLVFERDFSCSFLSVGIVDYGSDPSDAPQASALGILSYSQTEDVSFVESVE